jgi:hypothetical protein
VAVGRYSSLADSDHGTSFNYFSFFQACKRREVMHATEGRLHMVKSGGGGKPSYIRFEIFIDVNINVAIFWNIVQCSPYATDVSEESVTSNFRVR